MKIDLTEFGAVTGAILILGGTLKRSGVPGKFIPAITWLLGIIAYLALTSGWTDGASWVAGFMAAASGTGLHSASKNTLGNSKNATKSIGPLALCFALGLLGPLALTGCQTSSGGEGRSAQAISYQTLKSTQLAVDAAMQVYGTAVVTGRRKLTKPMTTTARASAWPWQLRAWTCPRSRPKTWRIWPTKYCS